MEDMRKPSQESLYQARHIVIRSGAMEAHGVFHRLDPAAEVQAGEPSLSAESSIKTAWWHKCTTFIISAPRFSSLPRAQLSTSECNCQSSGLGSAKEFMSVFFARWIKGPCSNSGPQWFLSRGKNATYVLGPSFPGHRPLYALSPQVSSKALCGR